MGLDVNSVLAVCIGIGLALFFFLPIAAAYMVLVEGYIKRNYPDILNKIVPSAIWILFFGIIGGVLFRLPLLKWLGGPAMNLEGVGRGASTLANLGLVFVVMIAGASQSGRDLRQFVNNVRVLLWPATVGSVGVLLGSLAFTYVVKLILPNLPLADANILWEIIWRGAAANVIGWIGDSTTFYPAFSILETRISEIDVFRPPAILLDNFGGVLWFSLAMKMADKHRAAGPASDHVISQPKSDTRSEGRKSARVMGVFCLAGVGAAIFLRMLPEIQGLHDSEWRALIVVGIFILAFFAGYLLARWDSRVDSRSVGRQLLLFAIGLLGLSIGLRLGLNNATIASEAFLFLSFIAIGAFAGHILMLLLFRRTSWGLLFVASMCAIGGLTTAPLVAERYSEDMVEPSLAVALWCNLLSLCLLLALSAYIK